MVIVIVIVVVMVMLMAVVAVIVIVMINSSADCNDTHVKTNFEQKSIRIMTVAVMETIFLVSGKIRQFFCVCRICDWTFTMNV